MKWAKIIIGIILVVGFGLWGVSKWMVNVIGRSMEPEYPNRSYYFVNRWAYKNSQINRGDVVLYKAPGFTQNEDVERIGRVVGLPGEKISIMDGNLIINDVILEESYVAKQQVTMIDPKNEERGIDVMLEPDEYYILGDNREVSADSRRYGPVRAGLIIGKIGRRVR